MTTAPQLVLHVLNHLDHGGAQDNTLSTCEGLDRDRWRVAIAAPTGGAQTARAHSAADVLLELTHLRRDISPAHELPAYRELKRVMTEVSPAVVHTHGSKAGVVGRLAAAATGVPAIVHTLHGLPVTPATPVGLRALLLRAERRAAARAHEVVCVCPANLEEARALGIVPQGQGVVVPSGVDEARFAQPGTPRRRAAVRAAIGIPHNAVIAVWVGRLMQQKAPLDLVLAATAALAAHPDLHVLVVGDGELGPQVQAATAGISRLHLLGHRTDVDDLLAASDLFVQTSLWEGLGRALTEACLSGLPVVATAVNGIPNLVQDGRTGLLVPAGRPDLMTAALVYAVSDRARLRRWGAAGAAATRGLFDTTAMVRGLDAVYRRCLEGDRSLTSVP
jgi:glycosyltransferase involved in cell wall biosynthesis